MQRVTLQIYLFPATQPTFKIQNVVGAPLRQELPY